MYSFICLHQFSGASWGISVAVLRFSNCTARAWLPLSMWDLSSPTRDQTHVHCIARITGPIGKSSSTDSSIQNINIYWKGVKKNTTPVVTWKESFLVFWFWLLDINWLVSVSHCWPQATAQMQTHVHCRRTHTENLLGRDKAPDSVAWSKSLTLFPDVLCKVPPGNTLKKERPPEKKKERKKSFIH